MKLLCLEGCSGSGKTTQYFLLQEVFKKQGITYLPVIEKNYQPFGAEVKRWRAEKGPQTSFSRQDVLNFAIARRETFFKNFRGCALEIMLLDRYFYTSAVYQSNAEISPKEILDINLNQGIPIPDVTLLLDCDPTIGFERAHTRNKKTGESHLFSTGPDKITSLREKYHSLLSLCPEMKLVGTEKPIQRVTEEILKHLDI